jgi:hypothetical protein
MIKDLSLIKDLPPGEYTLTLGVLQSQVKRGTKSIYLYAEGTSGKSEDVHLVGFDEFERTSSAHQWVRVVEKPTRPKPGCRPFAEA